MGRPITLVIALGVAVFGAAVGAASPLDDNSPYQRANARLAQATPQYPGARLLVEEPIWGEAGTDPFEAIQRIYVLARPNSQRKVISFYKKRLGSSWRQKGTACLVSRQRLVVALMYPRRRRLGVLIDSRGASRCSDHVANTWILLEVGYPDP
jgi:hypothetical protein